MATSLDLRDLVSMGLRVWYFLRHQPGDLRPIPASLVERFLSGQDRLPVDADGFVRYAQVIVRTEDRRATDVVQVGFYQDRAMKNGKLDRKHHREVMAVIPEVAFGGLQPSEPAPGVIEAGARFAKRRLEHLSNWKPTADEHAKLRALVNEKAGHRVT